MTIYYIIASVDKTNKGNGGHYYSLLITAEELSKKHDVKIINIGITESIALSNSNLDVINILGTNFLSLKILMAFYRQLKNDKPNIIHAFDIYSHFYARIIGKILKIPLVLTKCGGKNPKYFYPYCRDIICYSQENFSYFEKEKKFEKANIHYLPNRIKDFKSNFEKIDYLRNKFNLDAFDYIILRISRIGPTYLNSTKQLINLANMLVDDGINVCLLIIGSLDDKSIPQKLLNIARVKVFIENDRRFIKNAKEIIDVADIVMGTGRSFMEASIKDKIMLAPVYNKKIPVLVNSDNFLQLFSTNFSERGRLDQLNEVEIITELKGILESKAKRKHYTNSTSNLFRSKFDINLISENYSSLYSKSLYSKKNNFLDSLAHFFFILFKLFRSRKNILKSKNE